jgi:hypothetical protein
VAGLIVGSNLLIGMLSLQMGFPNSIPGILTSVGRDVNNEFGLRRLSLIRLSSPSKVIDHTGTPLK